MRAARGFTGRRPTTSITFADNATYRYDAELEPRDDEEEGLNEDQIIHSGDVPDDLKQRTGKAAKPNEVRVTTPYMTKYERARVLGTRALQIS